jgi:hypothetical protein
MAYWLAGLIGGIVAGVAMAMVAMMLMPVVGRALMTPVKLMAGTVEGERAMDGGPGTLMTGMMIHMMMSLILGVIFGAIMGALVIHTLGALIIAGVIWALIVFVVAQFMALPIIDRLMAERMSPWVFGMAHLVFGVVLGVMVWVLH